MMQNYIESYLLHLKMKNTSKARINDLRRQLERFTDWLHGLGISSPIEIDVEILEQYRSTLDRRALKPMTIYIYLTNAGSFIRWLYKKGIILTNPYEALSLFRPGESALPKVFSLEEIKKILGRPRGAGPVGIRNRTMLELLYCTGIRLNELRLLEVNDILFNRSLLFVREGKGKKDRYTPLGSRCTYWLKLYLDKSRPHLLNIQGSSRLFLNRKGNGFSSYILGQTIIKDIRRSGVMQGSTHSFRHSCATHMLERDCDIRYIQEILGHSSSEITKIYTNVSIKALRENHTKSHPSALLGNRPSAVAANETNPLNQQPFIRTRFVFKMDQNDTKEPPLKRPGSLPDASLHQPLWNYLFHLETIGYSYYTLKGIKAELESFLNWLEAQGIDRITDVTLTTLEAYKLLLFKRRHGKDNKPLSFSTQSKILSKIRVFFTWLFKKDLILFNPGSALELPRVVRNPARDILTPDEVEAVLDSPDVSSSLGIRDKAILEILYSTGMRRGELVNLLLEDLTSESSTCRIRQSKRGSERIVPVGQQALYWLVKYIQEIRPFYVSAGGEKYLFLSRKGLPYGRDFLGELIGRYIRLALGPERRGSCHILRHSCATHMLENGCASRYVQELLGHKSLSSTEIYTKVSIRRLVEAHKKSHPLYSY